MQRINQAPGQPSSQWLQSYYYLRAGVSVVWIALAVLVGKNAPLIGAALLVAYPAWDALANYLDARATGGLRSNPSQALNLAVSAITAVAVVIVLGSGIRTVILVYGAWAILSGLLLLATAVRRRKSVGAQWLLILSGAQSALAGIFFFKMATAATPPSIVTIVGYSGVGALYFLLSAIWLTVKNARQRSAAMAA